MLSVFGSRELQAVVLAMKQTENSLRPEIYKRTRESILPDWTGRISEELSSYPFAKFNNALLKNQRVAVGTQGVAVQAATSSRAIRKGSTLTPAAYYHLAEFGANPQVVPVQGRRGATRYEYKRTVNTGMLRRNRNGRFAYKVAPEIVSRSVAMWVQTVVQVMREAVEKGENG